VTENQLVLLHQPHDPADVRVLQKGGYYYFPSHHLIREANRIFGFDGWSTRIINVNNVQEHEKLKNNDQERQGTQWWVTYTACVELTVGTVIRQGAGAGQSVDADLGSAHDKAIKSACSDALKRALVTFGDQFGLILQDKSYRLPPAGQAPAKSAPDRTQQTREALTPTPEQAMHTDMKRRSWLTAGHQPAFSLFKAECDLQGLNLAATYFEGLDRGMLSLKDLLHFAATKDKP
jgi:hypothetical protein